MFVYCIIESYTEKDMPDIIRHIPFLILINNPESDPDSDSYPMHPV